MELTAEDIREILRIFAESELEELRLDVGETRLHVSKSDSGSAWSDAAATASPAAAVGQAQTLEEPQAEVQTPAAVTDTRGGEPPREGLFELHSPLLGVFYRRPSPDQPPFVEVGSEVDVSEPVCVIDVMKMFTQIHAGTRGRIVEICIEDGQLVEHGQVLMRIEPAEAS